METINDKLFKQRSCNLKFLAKEGFNTPKHYDFETYDDMENLIKDKSIVFAAENVKGLIQSENIFNEDFNSSVYFDFSNITTTTLLSITWSINSDGNIIPLATFEDVELGGNTYNKCSLKNVGHLDTLISKDKMKIGDEICLILKDTNIPHIISVISHNNGDEIEVPTHCPRCNSKLTISNTKFICENKNCSVKVSETLSKYVSLLNDDSISTTLLNKFVSDFNVTSISDLKSISQEKYDNVNTYNKIQEVLKVNKDQFLDLVIQSNNGVRVLSHIMDGIPFDTLLDENTTAESILKSKSITGALADSMIETIKDQLQAIRLNAPLFSIGTPLTLKNKIFCLTNTMTEKTKKEYETAIVENGGVIGNVTQKLDYLITNESNTKSAKYKKAVETNTKLYNNGKTHAINVLAESDLIKMMEK